jgi:hypothetical protein
MPPRRASAAGLVFALLVLATVAAFAWSQRLKRDPLVLDHVTFGIAAGHTFTPNEGCRVHHERISFRITLSDHATVQVIRPGGRLVFTLARDRYLPRYNFFTFYWDGRDRAGRIAPPGRYKLRVKLLAQERNLVLPGTIRLRRAPRNPTAGCRSVAKGAP